MLLIDCQGTGDIRQSNSTLDTMITYISLQMSNVQIINLKSQMTSEDLFRLQVGILIELFSGSLTHVKPLPTILVKSTMVQTSGTNIQYHWILTMGRYLGAVSNRLDSHRTWMVWAPRTSKAYFQYYDVRDRSYCSMKFWSQKLPSFCMLWCMWFDTCSQLC